MICPTSAPHTTGLHWAVPVTALLVSSNREPKLPIGGGAAPASVSLVLIPAHPANAGVATPSVPSNEGCAGAVPVDTSTPVTMHPAIAGIATGSAPSNEGCSWALPVDTETPDKAHPATAGAPTDSARSNEGDFWAVPVDTETQDTTTPLTAGADAKH